MGIKCFSSLWLGSLVADRISLNAVNPLLIHVNLMFQLYRNHSTDLHGRLIAWFLYDGKIDLNCFKQFMNLSWHERFHRIKLYPSFSSLWIYTITTRFIVTLLALFVHEVFNETRLGETKRWICISPE